MRATPRVLALAAAVLCAVTIASAQTTRAPTPQPQPAAPGQSATVNRNAPVPPTYAQLQQQNQALNAQINTARDQIMTMRNQSATLQQQNADLRRQIAEMTSHGGSLVRAYCALPSVSRNTAGGHTACGRYLCEPVSGLCRDRCTTTDDCARGYVCNETTCVNPF